MKKYIIVSQSYYSKNKDHGIQTHHFMANGWGRVETVTDFIFLGSKITADGDCGHERVGLYAGYMLNFWRNCQTIFQSDYTSYIPTTMCEGPATSQYYRIWVFKWLTIICRDREAAGPPPSETFVGHCRSRQFFEGLSSWEEVQRVGQMKCLRLRHTHETTHPRKLWAILRPRCFLLILIV